MSATTGSTDLDVSLRSSGTRIRFAIFCSSLSIALLEAEKRSGDSAESR